MPTHPPLLENPSIAEIPTLAEVKASIPQECFERSTAKSLGYAGLSVALTIALGIVAIAFIPMSWAWTPAWLLYIAASGTVATGVWVAAHECGHRGFSANTVVSDVVGFTLHSALLVPYFSWQRSHAIHHGKTNHLTEGETHVPKRADTQRGERARELETKFGKTTYGTAVSVGRLFVGWPIYLVTGITGGTERGTTNHFWPVAPFSDALFPKHWKARVWASTAGVATMLALLVWWGVSRSFTEVVLVYLLPYLAVNAWVVFYTWLQHTDTDVPHYEGDEWNFVRGAFCSIDRPYPKVVDFLHHRIGTTHAAHHLDAKIPHYNARKATDALAEAWPNLYRYDPTPISKAALRVARGCAVVYETDTGWRYDGASLEQRPSDEHVAA